MGGPGEGFEFPPQEVSWLKRYMSPFAKPKDEAQVKAVIFFYLPIA